MKWHTFEVMTPGPYCAKPETKLDELVREFNQRGISAAPVISSSGTLQGVVSLRNVALKGPEQTVSEVMTSPAITIDHSATIPYVLNAFKKHRVHRLVVTHGDSVLGVVSLIDLIGPLIEAYGYPNFSS